MDLGGFTVSHGLTEHTLDSWWWGKGACFNKGSKQLLFRGKVIRHAHYLFVTMHVHNPFKDHINETFDSLSTCIRIECMFLI